MAEDTVNVSIGAKIDDLVSAMQAGARAVDNFFGGPLQKLQKELDETAAAADRTSASVDRTGKEIKDASANIETGLSGLKSMLATAFAGFTLHEAVNTVLDFADATEELDNTAKIVGTTATAISRLHAVVTPMGIETGTLDGGLKRLARTMTDAARGGDEQARALDAVGIKAEELKNMSLEDVLAKIADRFAETEDGATKTALAQALLGKSGADLIPMLNLGSEEMRRQGEEAEKMGYALGTTAVDAGLKLDAAWDKLSMQGVGLKNVFAQSLAPALEFIADGMTDGSNTAMDFGSVFKGVASIVIAATSLIQQSWNIISTIVRGITIAISSIVTAIARAAQMDFSGAKAALTQGKEMITAELTDMFEKSDQLKQKYKDSISGIWSPKDAVAAPEAMEAPKEQLDFKPKEIVENEAAAAAKAAAAEAQAAAQKEFDYKMELLKNELAELEKGSEEKLAVIHEMTEAVKAQYGEQSREYVAALNQERQVTEEVAAEKIRIQDRALATARDHAALSIELERGKADMLLATGQINAVQRAEIERRTEEQIYAMQLAYLQQRLALYAGEPAEVERINTEIERLKGEHLLKLQDSDLAMFDASKAQWDSYFQSITDGFANAIQGMVFQGLTLQEAMGNILQNILGQLIQTGVKMAANWLSTQLAMTGATVANAATRSAAEAASAKESVTANAGAAIKNIMTKGAEVFANVYNAIAGIPYIGPFLAPVMAVAAGAAVVGMVGKVASAEGGWERVPYDGAMTELHKDEMVLPGPLAEGIRQLVENGGSSRPLQFNINAIDRRSIERLFYDHSDVLAGIVREQLARGGV